MLFEIFFVKGRGELVHNGAHACVADSLVVGVHRGLKLVVYRSLKLVKQIMVDVMMLILKLRLADLALDFLNKCADLLDLLMRLHQGVKHLILRNFLRAGLDHNDLVLGCAQGHVHLTDLALLGSRVNDNLTVYNADLATSNDIVKRDIGNGNRDGRAQQGNNLRRIVVIVLENRAYDRDIVAQILREQGAHRAVDLAGSQDCLFRRAAFTAHERAGNAANRIQALLEIHREREEINAVARLCGCGRGDEHNGLAVTHQARTVCQLRHLAGLNDQRAACEGGFEHAVVFKIKMIDVAHSCLLNKVFFVSGNRQFLALEAQADPDGLSFNC